MAKKSVKSSFNSPIFFTLFYLKQVKDNNIEENYWTTRLDAPSHRAWSGYAFEQVCLHHIPQIKAALGISGVATSVSSWVGETDGKKTGQIDLIIDRRDEVINLCEMKYSLNEYDITPTYMQKLNDRAEEFRKSTKTKKALHLTFVTINGVKHNAQWSMIQNEVTADDLFRP